MGLILHTSKWAKIIEKTANELCNESKSNPNPSKRVTNLSKSFNSTNFNFEIADRESLECLIIAIERNLNHMPEITRQIFDKLLVEFIAKREEACNLKYEVTISKNKGLLYLLYLKCINHALNNRE